MSPKNALEEFGGVFPGFVIDWVNLERTDVSWKQTAIDRLNNSGLKDICTRWADILVEDVSEFYKQGPFQEESDKIISRIQGVEVEVSEEVIRRVFNLPSDYVSTPSVSKSTMLTELDYEDPHCKKRDVRRNGFKGVNRFLAIALGYCFVCKSSSFDSVSGELLTHLYCLAKGIKLDWAKILYKLIKSKAANRGHGRIITMILRHVHPTVFETRPTISYPSRYILKRFLENGTAEARNFVAPRRQDVVEPKKKAVKEATTSSEKEVTYSLKKRSHQVSKSTESEGSSRSLMQALNETLKETLEENLKLSLKNLRSLPPLPTQPQQKVVVIPSEKDMPNDTTGMAPVAGGQAVPILQSTLTECELNNFWVDYAKSQTDPAEVYEVWLKYGKNLIDEEGLINWCVDQGYIIRDTHAKTVKETLTRKIEEESDEVSSKQDHEEAETCHAATSDKDHQHQETQFTESLFSKMLDQRYSQLENALTEVKEEIRSVKLDIDQKLESLFSLIRELQSGRGNLMHSIPPSPMRDAPAVTTKGEHEVVTESAEVMEIAHTQEETVISRGNIAAKKPVHKQIPKEAAASIPATRPPSPVQQMYLRKRKRIRSDGSESGIGELEKTKVQNSDATKTDNAPEEPDYFVSFWDSDDAEAVLPFDFSDMNQGAGPEPEAW